MAAGLGFKTFATGDVLSAGDTNGYLMQGVLVFATAAARDAAITSPQEGQCCYLKDTDIIQAYSGSAWVTKSAAGSSALTLITSSTFSSVSSVSLPTGTFSSTYDNYYLQVNFTSGSASGDSFVRFRTSGTDNTSASYFMTGHKINLTPTQTLLGTSSATSITSAYIEASSGTETNFSWTIFNPNLSAVTMLLMDSSTRSFTTDRRSAGFNGTTVFDSMTLFPVSGTFSGTYRIYGLQKS